MVTKSSSALFLIIVSIGAFVLVSVLDAFFHRFRKLPCKQCDGKASFLRYWEVSPDIIYAVYECKKCLGVIEELCI